MNNDILGGVRVLDFTTIVSGPYCTRLLADLGAEVIKIEPPEGDFIRTQPPIRAGKSAYFAHLNCGKKSLAIDLRQAGARELIRELAAKSDVVVENSRPGVMAAAGARLRDARAAESANRVLLDLGIWAERAVGDAQRLCADAARGQRFRPGQPWRIRTAWSGRSTPASTSATCWAGPTRSARFSRRCSRASARGAATASIWR